MKNIITTLAIALAFLTFACNNNKEDLPQPTSSFNDDLKDSTLTTYRSEIYQNYIKVLTFNPEIHDSTPTGIFYKINETQSQTLFKSQFFTFDTVKLSELIVNEKNNYIKYLEYKDTIIFVITGYDTTKIYRANNSIISDENLDIIYQRLINTNDYNYMYEYNITIDMVKKYDDTKYDTTAITSYISPLKPRPSYLE